MKHNGVRYTLGAAVFAAALGGMNVYPAAADDRGNDPRSLIAPSQSQPAGQTYGRWAAEWEQWALGVPASVNPVLDAIGENCEQRQVHDVWFLAGSFGSDPIVRNCEIPAGKSLFFPLINNAYFAFLNDPDRSEEFVRGQAKCTQPAEISLRIDGIRIPQSLVTFTGLRGSESPLFNVQLPPDNLFGADQNAIPDLALSPSAEQGYYIFLYPLRPGAHTIRWTASGCTAFNSPQDITYILNVVGAAHH